jgi:hypothetical protein
MREVMEGRRARAAGEESHSRAIKTIGLYIFFAQAIFISIAFLAVV